MSWVMSSGSESGLSSTEQSICGRIRVQRKMIICQLVREIQVSRGYELDIVLNMNYEQFLAQ